MGFPIIRGASNSTMNMSELAGSVFEEDGNLYKIVKASGALTNGQVVVYSGTDGFTVATTTTADNKLVAGVIAETIADTKYGKMLVYGVHSTVLLDGGTTDVAPGDALGTTTTAGWGETTTTAGAVFGVALDTAADTLGSEVFVRIM